jgi:hypothetical protein
MFRKISRNERHRSGDSVEIRKTVSRRKSTEPQRKTARERTFLPTDGLSESRGLVTKKPKYALLAGVRRGRRRGSGKRLAVRVGFELTVRDRDAEGIDFSIGTPSLSVIEPGLRLISPKNGNNVEDTRRISAQGVRNYQIGDTETFPRTQEARLRRASWLHSRGSLERPDWLAAVRGFELTHSISNSSLRTQFRLLGTALEKIIASFGRVPGHLAVDPAPLKPAEQR